MKRILIAAAAFLLAGPLAAQKNTVPELAAEKLCACIGESSQPDSAVARLQRCMPRAIADAALQLDNMRVMNTVEGIQGTMLKTRELAVKACPPVRNAYVAQRSKLLYAASAIPAAQQTYEEGTKLLEKQQYQEALPLFLQALRLDNRFVKAYDHAAICYRQLQEYKKAATYYEKSLALFPEGDLALLNMAVVQGLQEKPNEARSTFQKLCFYHPYNPEGYFGVGKMALLAGEFPAALDNLFQAHHLYVEQDSPYLADSNKMIGLLYSAMKEKNQLDLFRRKAQQYHFNIQE
jgi:tetratricopeptide (TPR) repeat protein